MASQDTPHMYSAIEERRKRNTQDILALSNLVKDHTSSNGSHVTRREVDEMKDGIRSVNKRVDDMKTCIDGIKEARISWYDRISVGAIVAVVTLLVNHFVK